VAGWTAAEWQITGAKVAAKKDWEDLSMKRTFAAILMLMLALSFCIPTATVLAANTEDNATGDVQDDRPDDTNDRPDDVGGVGGDNSTATTSISDEARAWANSNGFDLAAFEDYIAPVAHEPNAEDIAAFESWMSGGSNPRNQVLKQMQSAAGEDIANELWNYCNTIWKGWMNDANVGSVVSEASGLKNVGAMQEGMFAGYFGSLLGGSNGGDGYAHAGLLVKDGFVVSSDDVTYRLHNMADGSVAYEIAAPEGTTVSEDEFPDGVTSFTDFLPFETQEVTDEAKALLNQYAIADGFSEPSGVDRAVYQAVATYVNQEFGEYYGQCPGPTVVKGITALGIALDSVTEDTVGSSVGEKEFVASFFGTESAAASLWRLGFLPSFDGTTYRLHSGKDGTVVYEIASDEIRNTGTTDLAGTNNDPYVIVFIVLGIAVIAGGTLLAILIRRRKTKKQ
jgi:hypothetical protein